MIFSKGRGNMNKHRYPALIKILPFLTANADQLKQANKFACFMERYQIKD